MGVELRRLPSLHWFGLAIQNISRTLPLPKRVTIGGGTFYRFEQQTIEAAIFLKSARFVSSLHAGKFLLDNGFLQELGSIQRSLGDFEQDVYFLATARVQGVMTDLHQKFLSAFWEEEPSFEDYRSGQKNREEVPRRKIQSYLATIHNDGVPNSIDIATSKYLSRMYSGYIHGAAPHLMDMYNPEKASFDVSGSSSKRLIADHQHDFENYFYRGVIVISYTAHALGDDETKNLASVLLREMSPHFTALK